MPTTLTRSETHQSSRKAPAKSKVRLEPESPPDVLESIAETCDLEGLTTPTAKAVGFL